MLLNLYQTELRKPVHVVFCLDYSGSMNGQGIEKLREAMKVVLETSDYTISFSDKDKIDVIPFGSKIIDSIKFKNIVENDFKSIFNNVFGYEEFQKLAVHFSDALILDDDGVDDSIINYAKQMNKPILMPQSRVDFKQAYSDFYETIMNPE